jgi:hypothetical protein
MGQLIVPVAFTVNVWVAAFVHLISKEEGEMVKVGVGRVMCIYAGVCPLNKPDAQLLAALI